MKELFYMGGTLFMSILTILLILMLAWTVFNLIAFQGNRENRDSFIHRVRHIRSIGLFAMITGILGQLIGLYMAFVAIEQAGDISPAMVFGGLKVSMIPTLYGIGIYLTSILIWMGVDIFLSSARR